MSTAPVVAKTLRELIEEMPAEATVNDVLEELSRRDPVIWCAFYRRLRGHPLKFNNSKEVTDAEFARIRKDYLPIDADREVKARLLRHRPFLIEPMRDQHPWKAYEKARQMGISELSVSEVIHFLWSHPQAKWMYTFPREKQLLDFSTTRIAEAFAESPRIRDILGVPNQVTTKRIGDGYLLLRSAWGSELGEGVDADGVTFDEKDRMKDKIELAFTESLKSSRYGMRRDISTPTLPGRGVDISFSQSDQRHWFVKCTKCGEAQPVAYPDNIVQVAHIPAGVTELPPNCYDFLCRKEKCRGKLDRMSGEWVAKHPSRQLVRGYHIPQTIAPWITATNLMQDKLTFKWIQPWINYCLGLPAMGESMMISDADFQMADSGMLDFVTTRTPKWSHICVGIDWGALSWAVVIGKNTNGRNYLLNIGIFDDTGTEDLVAAKRVESFIAPYNPDIIIADAGYGKDRNAYLMRKFNTQATGRFWAQWYNPSAKGSRTFQPVWSAPEAGRVLVDRTIQLKVLCANIKERMLGLPTMGLEKMQLLKQHFKNLAQLREIDEETKELTESIVANGDDHLVHALGSAMLGMDFLTKTSRFNFAFV